MRNNMLSFALMQNQSQLIWGIKDKLNKFCSVNDMKELLIANGQEVPSGESNVRDVIFLFMELCSSLITVLLKWKFKMVLLHMEPSNDQLVYPLHAGWLTGVGLPGRWHGFWCPRALRRVYGSVGVQGRCLLLYGQHLCLDKVCIQDQHTQTQRLGHPQGRGLHFNAMTVYPWVKSDRSIFLLLWF